MEATTSASAAACVLCGASFLVSSRGGFVSVEAVKGGVVLDPVEDSGGERPVFDWRVVGVETDISSMYVELEIRHWDADGACWTQNVLSGEPVGSAMLGESVFIHADGRAYLTPMPVDPGQWGPSPLDGAAREHVKDWSLDLYPQFAHVDVFGDVMAGCAGGLLGAVVDEPATALPRIKLEVKGADEFVKAARDAGDLARRLCGVVDEQVKDAIEMAKEPAGINKHADPVPVLVDGERIAVAYDDLHERYADPDCYAAREDRGDLSTRLHLDLYAAEGVKLVDRAKRSLREVPTCGEHGELFTLSAEERIVGREKGLVVEMRCAACSSARGQTFLDLTSADDNRWVFASEADADPSRFEWVKDSPITTVVDVDHGSGIVEVEIGPGFSVGGGYLTFDDQGSEV
jgi:hypothetical protein